MFAHIFNRRLTKGLVQLATLLLLGASPGSHALEIGNISIHSKLNEPLKAIILLTGSPEELKHVQAHPASDERYTSAGIPRHPLLDSLRYAVIVDTPLPRIEITSVVNIKEPLLDVIVDIRSDNSRFIKEFSLLLSP